MDKTVGVNLGKNTEGPHEAKGVTFTGLMGKLRVLVDLCSYVC